MASLRKKDRSPFWYACFSMPDGIRTQRSTGVPYQGVERADFERLKETLTKLLGEEVTLPESAKGKVLSATDARRLAMRIASHFEDASREASAGGLTEARARKTIADIYAVANRDKMPSSNLDAYLDGWLSRKALEAGENTHTKYVGIVDRFKTFLGSRTQRDISAITAADITKWRDDMAGNLSVGTVNVALKIIRSAFAAARRDGLIDVNQAERVSILKRRRDAVERRPFTLDEVKSLLKVASEEWQGMILFGLYSGQRLGDLAALTWQNVDLQRQELRLVTEKTGRRAIIPLAMPLVRHLMTLPTSDDPAAPLFPKAFGTVERLGRASQLSNQFYDLLVSANLAKKKTHHVKEGEEKGRDAKRTLSKLSFHCLRHTATSLLKNAGVSDAVAMEFIGHDSAAVSRNYTHISAEALKGALASMPDVTV
jgi:integrase